MSKPKSTQAPENIWRDSPPEAYARGIAEGRRLAAESEARLREVYEAATAYRAAIDDRDMQPWQATIGQWLDATIDAVTEHTALEAPDAEKEPT